MLLNKKRNSKKIVATMAIIGAILSVSGGVIANADTTKTAPKSTQPTNTSSTADIASGTYGTSPWRVDGAGVLHVGAGTLGDTTVPWRAYKDKILKIVIDHTVKANPDSSYLFADLSKVTNIEGMSNLDTSNVTNMSYMFSGMAHLTSIDLDWSKFDMSKVTNTSDLFDQVPDIASGTYGTSPWRVDGAGVLHVGAGTLGDTTVPWRAYKDKILKIVIDHTVKANPDSSYLFAGLSKVASFEGLSNLDMSNVTNTAHMFSDCPGSLDVENWLMKKPTITSSVKITKGLVKGSTQLRGTATPGATVDVWKNRGGGKSGDNISTVRADGNGNWTANFGSALETNNTILIGTELNGKYLNSDTYTVGYNDVTPTITDGLNSGTTELSGTATPGATVDVWKNRVNGDSGEDVSTVTADDTGHWTADFGSEMSGDSVLIGTELNGKYINSDIYKVPGTNPVIKKITGTWVSGTADPGAKIQLVSDREEILNDGTYGGPNGLPIGSGTADSDGNWKIYSGHYEIDYNFNIMVNAKDKNGSILASKVCKYKPEASDDSGVSVSFSWGDFPHATLFPA